MKKSGAGISGRKLLRGALTRDQWAMVALAALFMPATALARSGTPLPQPRPAAALAPDGKGSMQVGEGSPATPETALEPSTCRLALTDSVAIAPSVPAITGPGGCGGDDLVRLEAVVLRDGGRVAVKPAATLRCTMASAIADWIRSDMAPLAEKLGSRVSELDNLDSFECRGRNRVTGAKLSEHGRANALDVGALKLANGRTIGLTDRAVERDLREKVLGSVCARFTTVLGPGSDGYHENHIHLDLIQRRNDYRICHWEIYDSMAEVAPLLPAERPAEAPRREMVEEGGKASEAVPERGAVSRVAPQAGSAAARAFSGEVESGSREENAPNQKARVFHRFREAVKDSKSAEVVPEPQKRPAAADAAGEVSRKWPKPTPSASGPPTRRSAAHSVKRKRRLHSDLPPFLRSLFD